MPKLREKLDDNQGLSLTRAVDWNTNERFVCTSREFWQLIFLVLDGIFFYAKTQRKVRFTIEVCPLLVLLTGIPMNVMFARAVSFGNLFFLLWIEILFLPKLREKLDLQSRCVPVLCVLRKRLFYFCAFLTFSFGYVKIVLWKYCLLM